MGRSLGLEEEDVALDLPDLPTSKSLNDLANLSESLFIWRVHHARMLSQWHQSSNLDLDASFASYEYWKESINEISRRMKRLESANAWSDPTERDNLDVLMHRDELTES